VPSVRCSLLGELGMEPERVMEGWGAHRVIYLVGELGKKGRAEQRCGAEGEGGSRGAARFGSSAQGGGGAWWLSGEGAEGEEESWGRGGAGHGDGGSGFGSGVGRC